MIHHKIVSVGKRSLIIAIIFACVIVTVSNNLFYYIIDCIWNYFRLPESDVEFAWLMGNLVDYAQIVCYIGYRIIRAKSLNRYDLPFIISGMLALYI